ncbi:MAG TPA: GNAT family N-acetyltransferase [Dongiaceae bacterium]|jgi:GNAT superfamily N-acetyltransferase|nr:GNAT family N-acetyltransferase [Dongiaceae bacterium]
MTTRIPVVVTYLEMTERPTAPAPALPRGNFALLHVERPSVAFYRYLYNTVGERWFWVDRRRMDDETLRTEIQDESVEISVLYGKGEPVGFVELDGRTAPTQTIAYFGLMPDWIGRGIGRYLLRWAVDRAWQRGASRIAVETCTLDHPAALGHYQRLGFRPYRQKKKHIPDPRIEGFIPACHEPLGTALAAHFSVPHGVA